MKVIKFILVPLVLILGVGFACFQYLNESLPKGTIGSAADELANNMLLAVSNDKWVETGAVKWEFLAGSRTHKHIWDKKRHFAQVEFDQNIVQIDINGRRGVVLNNSQDLSELMKLELCEKAWKFWANDSFWLNPVSKIFDPGTSRGIVEQESGTESLLITYATGGVTPGDSYLWILDENNRPTAWKMWVSIIPIGGLEFSWERWTKLATGALISTTHQGLVDISISNVRGESELNELTGSKDIFAQLSKATIQF
ncbi:MAG: hypothetical protein ACJA2S_005724 [Cyclobacteriaceae bacterium]|jgi:hypothetical protein